MKKSFIAIALIAFSTSGCAQLTPNEVFGAAVGGIAGSQIGKGNGRLAATAAGAVIGANVGRQIGPQPGVVYGPVIPTAPRGYPPGYQAPYAYGSYDRPYDSGCEHEQYIDGVYNPPAAQAHCRGRMEREARNQHRYEREAYERGLKGVR